MMRKGFTLVELLIVLMIFAIFVLIVAGLIYSISGSVGYHAVGDTGIYRCVKTYTSQSGDREQIVTNKRVDLKEIQDGNEIGSVQTFNCDDNFFAGVRNSGTLYAQFEPGKFYKVTSVGYRREGWYSLFPLVKSVEEIPDPTIKQLDNPIRSEIGYDEFN